MLTANYKDLENIVDIVQDALADEEIRMQCEARERYERDRTSLYNSGKREGHAEGIETGVKNAIQLAKNCGVAKDKTLEQIMVQFELQKETAVEKMDLYWK